ncbi:hypothetical protein EKPJFOCH_3898 [Methylobacterium thuringiense]|uniref:Uncharacterized protein n=1 Tax=Methylobacterium thuringiense TaxID=1003091 RepID=A0ABQ4TR79_9HYPH|nr:hypothetical protein EKPJFOCH_3898 [Methylobacterium thuringiense]
MPKVPNERGPDEKPAPKPERRPDEGGIGKTDTGGLVRPPSEPGAKAHVQDGPMERPGTEAGDRQ